MKIRTILLIAVLGVLGSPVSAGAVTATAPVANHSLVVPRDYPTIQAAVDAATAGDHIDVRAGTYREEVLIGKDLDIRGAGVGATSIKAPTTLTPYGVHLPDGRAVTAIVRIANGAHVRISSLTVTGPIPCGIEVSGVNVMQAATLTLSDARVTAIHPNPTTCSPDQVAGRAVVFGLPPHILADGVHGSTAFGVIRRVMVDHYQHAGISVTGPADGPPSRVRVVDNEIIGGSALPSFQFGIHLSAGAIAQVSGNRVVENVCRAPSCGPDPINQGQGIGIVVQSALASSVIVQNDVGANDVGVYQVDSVRCCTVALNRIHNNRYFGIVIQDGDGTAHDNVITGGRIGIGVVADFVDTTGVLVNNRISRTTAADVREIDCCGYRATAIVS